MANLNRVFMMGHVTRDLSLRRTPGGATVTTLGLAVNSVHGSGADKKEEVIFIDVNVWGKTAENCVAYLKKGSPVFVEGRLISRAWDDKESGQKKYKTEITASSIQFLPSGKGKPDEVGAGNTPPADDDDVPF